MPSLYFSFPDGVFDYVCAECNALCCRGHGFAGSLKGEMAQLVTLYPSLESAALQRRGSVLTFTTPTRGCHFLGDDNLCRIEKEHGWALKPGVCRLFPFNALSRIGKTVVVSPHFLCPLRLHVPARPGEVEGTHARLEPLVRESGLLGDAHMTVSMQPARLHPSEGVRSVLAREAAFRDRCGGALGGETFSGCLRDASADPAKLDHLVGRAAALLGLAVPPERGGRDGLDDILLAVAPPVRIGLLRLPAEGILLALGVAELMVRRVASLSYTPPTPQDAVNTIAAVLPALHLLGCAEAPVSTSRRGTPKTPPFGDPAMVFAGYRVLRGVGSDTGILDLLEAGMQRLTSVADRTAFLVEMGGVIGPSVRRVRSQAKADAR